MAFWTEQANEPKRNYRFLVQITGLGSNDVQWWARNFKVPSYTVTEAKHDFLDNQYYFPGRVQWEESTMELVDPVSPNAVALTNQLIIDSGYKIKGESDASAPVTMSKKTAGNAIGDVIISIFDGDGEPIEIWTLKNPFIKGVSFSDLNYENDELRTITVSFRYDWAVCDNSGAPQAGADPQQFTV